MVEKLGTRGEKKVYLVFPFILVMCGITLETRSWAVPTGRAMVRVPTRSDSCLVYLAPGGFFLSHSVISERFDAGAGRGSPKQVRRLTRGQKKKKEMGGRGEIKAGRGSSSSSSPALKPTGAQVVVVVVVSLACFHFWEGSSFGQGTRGEGRPTGVGWAWCGRRPWRLACFWSLFFLVGVGRDWASWGPGLWFQDAWIEGRASRTLHTRIHGERHGDDR